MSLLLIWLLIGLTLVVAANVQAEAVEDWVPRPFWPLLLEGLSSATGFEVVPSITALTGNATLDDTNTSMISRVINARVMGDLRIYEYQSSTNCTNNSLESNKTQPSGEWTLVATLDDDAHHLSYGMAASADGLHFVSWENQEQEIVVYSILPNANASATNTSSQKIIRKLQAFQNSEYVTGDGTTVEELLQDDPVFSSSVAMNADGSRLAFTVVLRNKNRTSPPNLDENSTVEEREDKLGVLGIKVYERQRQLQQGNESNYTDTYTLLGDVITIPQDPIYRPMPIRISMDGPGDTLYFRLWVDGGAFQGMYRYHQDQQANTSSSNNTIPNGAWKRIPAPPYYGAMVPDGNRVAVSPRSFIEEPKPDSWGTDVRVYQYVYNDSSAMEESTWEQVATIPNPTNNRRSMFGEHMDWSNDGRRLAISAPKEDGDVGAIYIYDETNGCSSTTTSSSIVSSSTVGGRKECHFGLAATLRCHKGWCGTDLNLAPDGRSVMFEGSFLNHDNPGEYGVGGIHRFESYDPITTQEESGDNGTVPTTAPTLLRDVPDVLEDLFLPHADSDEINGSASLFTMPPLDDDHEGLVVADEFPNMSHGNRSGINSTGSGGGGSSDDRSAAAAPPRNDVSSMTGVIFVLVLCYFLQFVC